MSETVEQKLDRLADYEAQRDLIEINKRAALDEIKIPAEIQAIVNSGMARMNNIDIPGQDDFEEETRAALAAIVVPDEIKAQLAAIDARRVEIMKKKRENDEKVLAIISAEKSKIQAEINAATEEVYKNLALRKAEIEEEFAGKVEAVNSNIEALKAEIKKETIAARQTFKGKFYQSIFTNGRVTWDLAMMEAWRATFPFLEKARKEGEPSTQLRKI